MFGLIIMGLLMVEIFCYLKNCNIIIKMLEGVLLEVFNFFVVLVLVVVILVLFWGICYFLDFNIFLFLSMLLMFFKGVLVGNSLFGGLLMIFFIIGFWILGIYGVVIMDFVIWLFWEMLIV